MLQGKAPCYTTTTNTSVFLGVVFLALFSFSLFQLVLFAVLSKHTYPFLSPAITTTIIQAALIFYLHYCNSLLPRLLFLLVLPHNPLITEQLVTFWKIKYDWITFLLKTLQSILISIGMKFSFIKSGVQKLYMIWPLPSFPSHPVLLSPLPLILCPYAIQQGSH